MVHPSGSSASAPALAPAAGPRGLVRWVCTSNPFYVLSALMVCLGLWVSFGSQARAAQTWALLSGMAGYTLLLAVTACLLVRFVGVWDDVRTVLLLVVLMFLATSVTFDEVLARDPARGIACYLGGLLFAVAVSEGLLRGMPLRLPALFRVPYYGLLALFFVYPVAVTPLLDRPHDEALSWALFGFSPAAGLVSLGLLPAIRRGRGYVRHNGSPWRWAWYPWTLFGVLGFGVMARSALLCWSMHHVERSEIEPYLFGFYFLVPFLLAVGVLLMEIGLVERRRGVVLAALAVPPILIALAAVGHRHEAVYEGFLAQFRARLGGTPLYLTVLASAGFYAYAALRRVPLATEALTAALAALAVVGPGTLDLDGLTPARPLPLLAVAALQLGIGLRRRDAWRCLLGAGCLAACAAIGFGGTGGGVGALRNPIAFHLVLLAVLVIGATFDDPFGRFLRFVGAVMALMAGLVELTGPTIWSGPLPAWLVEAYPLAMAALIAGYGARLGHRPAMVCGGMILGAWLLAAGSRVYGSLRHVVAGLDYIAIGMALFTMAVLTSLAKGKGSPWRAAPGKAEVPDLPG